LLEIGDDHARPQPDCLVAADNLDVRRRPLVGFDGAREFLLDPRAQDLDCNRAPFGGDSAMDLGDGRGADGIGMFLCVDLLYGPAEAGLVRRADGGEGMWGHVVL
jgi:hypothetical protein